MMGIDEPRRDEATAGVDAPVCCGRRLRGLADRADESAGNGDPTVGDLAPLLIARRQQGGTMHQQIRRRGRPGFV